MNALIIAVTLSVPLLAAGCGGGDDGSKRAVEWNVERLLGPRSARLAATFAVCTGPVRLEPPIIVYSGDRAYIELRRAPERFEGEQDGCFLSLLTLQRTVAFNRDLDELTLFDASTDPPEQRWPRRR